MDALIFDFDGVIADTEPLHFQGFVAALSGTGISLEQETYFRKYSGFDDTDGFTEMLRDHNIEPGPGQVEALREKKTAAVKEMLARPLPTVKGALEIIRSARDSGLPMAICSGSLKDEIEIAARLAGIRDCFEIIVSAEDVPRGKPDPEGYYKARRLLAEHFKRVVEPARCVVCEDTPAGISAAKAAGMKVCALSTTFAPDNLGDADMIIGDFTEVTLEDLASMV